MGTAMMPGWRDRLLEAIAKDGRSDRAISLAANLGPNFVNQLRHDLKDPKIKSVIQLADELKISLAQLFTGLEVTPRDEEFWAMYRSMPEAERAALLALLSARNAAE